ncbi:hypothetical protein GQ42DRAFT_129280, partial [Ramicandelaber brevisporus]
MLTVEDIPDLANLPEDIRSKALEVFNKTRSVWGTEKDLKSNPLRASELPPVSIRVKPDTQPINKGNYRMSPVKSEAAMRAIETLMKDGIIKEQNSQWSWPLVIVHK